MSNSPPGSPIPPQYRPVGITLAIASGLLIGASFPLKKLGLLRSQKGKVAGEGVAYLRNPIWWAGMIMMIVGEICNFGAYAFVEAIVVTPLGALSVVISAILSSIFLGEKLTTLGWLACFQAIVGSIVIALNGPKEEALTTIAAFKQLFLAPWFLAYGSVIIALSLVVMFYFGPKYGSQNMFWYISVCSMIGGLSVSCTQGLGASIVTSIRGDNQFTNWFIFFLLGFVVCTLLTEIFYLNKALALYNTSFVTPMYYTFFTTMVIVTSVILYQGFHATAIEIITVVMGFLFVVTAMVLLQMSKVDPTTLPAPLTDKRTNILLEAARQEISPDTDDPDKAVVEKVEEPGMDALRGTFGAVGSLVRMRRRATILSERGSSHGAITSGITSGGQIPGSTNGTFGPHLHGSGKHEDLGRVRTRPSNTTLSIPPRIDPVSETDETGPNEQEPTISYLISREHVPSPDSLRSHFSVPSPPASPIRDGVVNMFRSSSPTSPLHPQPNAPRTLSAPSAYHPTPPEIQVRSPTLPVPPMPAPPKAHVKSETENTVRQQ